MLQSESEAVAGRLQPRCAVDETDRITAEMVFDEVRKTHFGESPFSRRTEASMEQALGVGIDRGVPLISLVVGLKHRFFDRNSIRVSTGHES